MIYYIPILLCVVTIFSRELSDNRRWYYFFGILLCLFYCFGYMTGTDWRVYEDLYNTLDFSKFYYGYSYEPGYYLYMMIFRMLGVGFWPFFILTKSLLFCVIYKTIFDYCKSSGYVTIMYFLPWFGMYLFIDNPMRNFIAIGIFILSFRYIIQRKFWKFMLCMLLAASFHFSALFIIPFYFILISNIRRWVYVVLFVIINILFINRDFLIEIMLSLFGKIPYLQNKIITYLLLDSVFAQGKQFSLNMVWQMALFILMLFYKDLIVTQIGSERGVIVFNAAMCYMLLLRFAMSIQMFVRIQLYFSVFLAIAVGLVMLSFEYKSRIIYVCIMLLISLYVCSEKITSSARYVPYSNYVEYVLKGEYPSYSKRFFYNIKHSPYTNELDFE